MDIEPSLQKLFPVPGWLSPPFKDEDERFYVALPLGHNLGENFAAYSPSMNKKEAEEFRDKVVKLGLPLFGIIRVSTSGGRVVWRNDDPITGEAPKTVNEGFGTW